MIDTRYLLFIFSFFLFISIYSHAQNLTELNDEKRKLLSVIEENNKMITQYSDMKSSELMQISVIDDKIAKRKRLMSIYKNEIYAYNLQIKYLTNQLDSLENEIFDLKEEYSRIIYQQYLNRMYQNSLIYLLSASSFNESYRRFLFLQQYNDYRCNQAKLLEANVLKFNDLKLKVEEKRSDLNALLTQAKRESKLLEQELSERKNKVDKFSQETTNLQQQILDAEKQAKVLEEKIVALIIEETKKRELNANLSADILKNKGILPWPTEKHVVVSTFGEHEHPLIPSISVKNNGIDIDVLDNREVHAIHVGRVSRIIMIPGSNASVIVRHGSVLTVYSNLDEVSVKRDDVVSSSTVLGTVYNGEGINSNILHFELWNGEEKQNPMEWLKIY